MVGAFGSGPGGDLVLNAFETEPVPQLDVELTVDTVGRVQPRTGTAWVSGTVTCSVPAFVDLSADLAQRSGRSIIRGFGFAFLACDGETSFELEIPGFTGLFSGGQAQARVDLFACPDGFFPENVTAEPDNGDGCVFEVVEQAIRLRGGPAR